MSKYQKSVNRTIFRVFFLLATPFSLIYTSVSKKQSLITQIGQNCVIDPDATIGNKCMIQNNVSVYKGVTLEDGVFCGPYMVFTNIFNPRAEIGKMDQVCPSIVKKGATLGANCTIVYGHTIGQYAFIDAGAVVTKNSPAAP